MKLQEVTGYDLQSKTILNESWEVLTESQRLHVGAWEKRVWPLMEQLNVLFEAELTADQIQKIFTSAEQVANATGNNRTALGKAGDVTKEVSTKIKAEIDKLIKQAADSEPVKNMDAQFDKLRAQLATKVKDMPGGSKILAGVDKWKGFAQENPAKSAFIIGAMTSVLAFASGGIMSGAAIGFFLRLANNTIKGDKLSTAIGKGVKGAAIGAIAGALGDVVSGMDLGEPEFEGGPAEVNATASSDEIASAGGEETAQALADMTEEQFKQAYARELLERQAERFNMPVTDAMIQKIADNVEITGNYPDDYNANFEGTFVRGTTYLTPDEAQEYSRIVQANGGGMEGAFSKEANEFIKDAGGAGPNIVPDGGTDPETGDEPETDLGPGEGFTTDSGATYSKEDLQNLVQQAAEKGEVPDISSLVDSKDIDAGSYADDVSAIETELRELGIDPLKVPDEDALKAVGVEDAAEVDTNTVKYMGKEYTRDELLAAKQDGSIKRSIANTLLRKLKLQDANESLEEQLWSALEVYELQEAPNFMAAMGGAAKGIGKVAAKGADAVSKVAAKGAEKAGAAINTAKSDLGNKVTANKLMRMWKKAGSPTDMGSIVNILSGAGIPDSQIGTVGKQANIPLEKPAAPAVDIKSLAAEIQKAGVADIVKQMLTATKPKVTQQSKAAFRAKADRARSMKAKPVRSDMYTDQENTEV